MKHKIFLLYILPLIFLITSCSGNSDIAHIDKDKKAIVSTSAEAFKKVMVVGAGKNVTFQGFSNDRENAVIYFNRVNPGFLVSDGFGLNKDYILRLVPGKKYTAYIYNDPKDEKAYPIYFRTDYNNNIVIDTDSDK